jgi:hypothetical protein
MNGFFKRPELFCQVSLVYGKVFRLRRISFDDSSETRGFQLGLNLACKNK